MLHGLHLYSSGSFFMMRFKSWSLGRSVALVICVLRAPHQGAMTWTSLWSKYDQLFISGSSSQDLFWLWGSEKHLFDLSPGLSRAIAMVCETDLQAGNRFRMDSACYIWNKQGPLSSRHNGLAARHPGRHWERVNKDTGHLIFFKDSSASLNTPEKLEVPVPMEHPKESWPVIYIKSSHSLISPTMASFLPYEPVVSVRPLICGGIPAPWITIPFLFIKVNPHKDTFIRWLVMPQWAPANQGLSYWCVKDVISKPWDHWRIPNMLFDSQFCTMYCLLWAALVTHVPWGS